MTTETGAAPAQGTTGTGAASNAGGQPNGATPAPAAAASAQPATTPQDPKAAGAAPGQNAPASTPKTETPPASPAELELKVPERATLDPKTLEVFKSWAKDGKVEGKQAQALLDQVIARQTELSKELEARAQQEEAAVLKTWDEQLAADKELGGAKLKENMAAAMRFAERLAPDGSLRKFLADTRLDRHPTIVRAFHRLSQVVSEDSIGGTQKPPEATGNSADAALRARFPSMFKNP